MKSSKNSSNDGSGKVFPSRVPVLKNKSIACIDAERKTSQQFAIAQDFAPVNSTLIASITLFYWR